MLGLDGNMDTAEDDDEEVDDIVTVGGEKVVIEAGSDCWAVVDVTVAVVFVNFVVNNGDILTLTTVLLDVPPVVSQEIFDSILVLLLLEEEEIIIFEAKASLHNNVHCVEVDLGGRNAIVG